jgi:hypothetical protein
MARRYRILAGNTFDLGAGRTAGAGEEIELEDDVAKAHAHRVEPVVDEGVQTSGPADTGSSES